LIVLAHSGCPAAPLPRDVQAEGEAACNRWRRDAIARIRALKPQTILVSSYSKYLPEDTDRLPAWDATLDQLRAVTAHLGYLVDTPTMGTDVPVCISGHLDDWAACAQPRAKAVWPDPVVGAHRLGREPDVSILDLNGYLCPAKRCPAVSNGMLMYRDDTHITASLARIMQPAMAAALDAAHLMTPRK
jgi:diadenosine tetraphosphatase ApaH/serine/threonine PP2A family protein phosphatase